MTTPNIRAVRNPDQVASGQSSSVSQDNSQADNNGQLMNEFSQMQRERSDMRSEGGAAANALSQANNAASEAQAEVDKETNAQEEATNEVSNQNHIASESTANASRLNGEARNFRAAARGRPPAIANQLLNMARQKEAEALQEEQKARAAQIASSEAQRVANRHEQNAGSARAEVVQSREAANNLSVQRQNLGTGAGNVQQKVNALQPQVSRASAGSGGGGGAYGGGVGGFGGLLGGVVGIIVQIAQLLRNTNAQENVHPSILLAMWRNIQSLTEQGLAMVEAAIIDQTIQGTPLHQAAILMKTKLQATEGESKQNAEGHQKTIEEYKRAEKDTHNLMKRA